MVSLEESKWSCEDCEVDLDDNTVCWTDDDVPLCESCFDYLCKQAWMEENSVD